MSKPEAPTPPNPYATAAAQTGTNVSTGVANAFLNNVNQVTPQGNLSYDVTDTYSWKDPSTGQTYSIPRFTSTQSLSPTGQQLQNTSDQTKLALGNIGLQQTNRIGGMLGTPFNSGLNAQQYLQNNPDVLAYAREHGLDPMAIAAQHYQNYGQAEGRAGGAPVAGTTAGLQGIGPAKTGYDAAGRSRARSATPATSPAATARATSARTGRTSRTALMARMNPQLSRERGNIEQRLADQGIRYGSQAYASAMDDYNRQANDARFAAVGQAGSEQQRMMDMAAQRAGFQNSAQQQAYDQAMGAARLPTPRRRSRTRRTPGRLVSITPAPRNIWRSNSLASTHKTPRATNTRRNSMRKETSR